MDASEIYLRTGPFAIHLTTSDRLVREGIALLYDESCFLERPDFCDFHVGVRSPFLRRWVRPKVEFVFEGGATFKPSPPAHALPMFEWGLNWVIASTANDYLIAHAAVAERGGRAIILPGQPGSGKSTLCAGLVHRGWRLLSDELALILPDTRELLGLARPISLKNESIEVVRRFAPGVVMSRPAEATLKGTIVLVKPPLESVRRVAEPASPGWILFPSFEAGAATRLEARPKAEAFIELAANAINYSVLGADGFEVLSEIVDRSGCYELAYSDLEDAVRVLTELADAA